MSTQACGAAEVKSFLANAPDGFPGTFSHLLKGHRKAIDKIIMGAIREPTQFAQKQINAASSFCQEDLSCIYLVLNGNKAVCF